MSKTKTITLGKDAIIELIDILNQFKHFTAKESERTLVYSQQINKADTFVSLLKSTPWNEGGYCEDELT